MKLTPTNIRQQEFKTSFRGYDKEDVQTFLEIVASELEDALNEIANTKHELLVADSKLEQYLVREQSIQNSIISAQDTANRSIESANTQASQILNNAHAKAQKIIAEANNNLEAIKASIIALKQERDNIITKLKAIVDSQTSLFNVKDDSDIKDKSKQKMAADSKGKQEESESKLNIDNIIDKII